MLLFLAVLGERSGMIAFALRLNGQCISRDRLSSVESISLQPKGMMGVELAIWVIRDEA